MKIGALVSGGKDSLMALLLAKKKRHKPAVLIAIKSKNPDSYMYHTPEIDLVKKQAGSIGLPLIIKKTKGVKEKELKELKTAILEAKEKYKVRGIVSGALFSEYQRNRIARICKELNLKCFTPLWHMDQEQYMYDLIKNKFQFCFTKIAADGLNKNWLGKIITKNYIDKLVRLSKKCSFNISMEGGEAESLTLDCPLFKKRIVIRDFKTKMENDYTGKIIIKKYSLVKK